MNGRRLYVATLYGIFFFSGVAGLGYQIAWTRVFAVGLGHEIASVLAVVAAFFGGFALGAWLLDGPASRSRAPGLWYAGLEILIGVWGLLSIALIPIVGDLGLRIVGVAPSPSLQWGVAFGLPLLTLLPATAAMGATLAAMERFVAPLSPDGRCVGALYATNTAGAVCGTLSSAFFLIPSFGYRWTILALAAVNLLCGLATLGLSRRAPRPHSLVPVERPSSNAPRRRIGLAVFFTGLLGIGYEVLGVRVLGQVLESTIYSFAAVLSVYLLGTAVGAALYQRFGRKLAFETTLAVLLCALSTSCVLGALLLSHASAVYYRSAPVLGFMGAELVVAGLVFAPPTILMGATFSHLVQAAKRRTGGVGRAMALNTLGGLLAPALFGVLLLPAIGAKRSLVLAALGYLLLLPRPRRVPLWAPLLPLLLVLALPAQMRSSSLHQGDELLEYREGVMAAVMVVESDDGKRRLRVNNRWRMGATGSAKASRRLAHLPLLLHPNPRRALFLGVGTGISFGETSMYADLRADGVELVPEVLDVMHHFEPDNKAPRTQPNLHLYAADARRFVRATEESYDVIVADLFHPSRDGAGSLYTLEHFEAIRERLAPSGLFCQWLPMYQLEERTIRVIVRTFLEVFPHANAYLSSTSINTPALGIVGTLSPQRYGGDWLQDRARDPRLRSQLEKLTLTDALDLFGRLAAGGEQLRKYASNAAVNTDDHPRVTFEAPRFLYDWETRGAPPYESLRRLLTAFTADSRPLLATDTDPTGEEFRRRVAGAIEARDFYLHGRMAEAERRHRDAAVAYLKSAHSSVDFTSGYDRCLELIEEGKTKNPKAARVLADRLVTAQPLRPEGRQLLEELNRGEP